MDAIEYDEEQHPDTPVADDGILGYPGGYTYADALQDAIERVEGRGGIARRVIHPGDPRAGPVADEPRVDLS